MGVDVQEINEFQNLLDNQIRKTLKICNRENLENILSQYGIETSMYGTGCFKSVGCLLGEIQNVESKLVISAQHKLIRIVKAVEIFVYSPDRSRILFEENQKFTNGSIRTRNHYHIGEKVLGTEVFGVNTAIRALKEELGIEVTPEECELEFLEKKSKEAQSKSYPGINTIRIIKCYECVIPYRHFNGSGYKEVQPSKTTTFVWKTVPNFLKK